MLCGNAFCGRLRTFVQEIWFSLKNIAVNDCEGTKTVSLPLYLVWNIDFYSAEADEY